MRGMLVHDCLSVVVTNFCESALERIFGVVRPTLGW